jgi:hypothetical protein
MLGMVPVKFPAGKRVKRMIRQDVSRGSVEARVLHCGRFQSERQPICRDDDMTEYDDFRYWHFSDMPR